ncbi:MAG: tyrosine-type recombinase/integrase [Ignavibacteriales bacterium]|nr:MAG: tyrosine-type recombinase/integrase [Ignavibacteriales bacterium]
MRKSFLFKRGKYYQLQYFDETEQRIKRISTKCKMKTDAIKFLSQFNEKKLSQPELKYISLSQFLDEYLNYVKQNLSVKYYNDVHTTFKRMKETFGEIPLNKLTGYNLEQFLTATYQVSKYACKHHFNNLRSAFNKAIQWGYLEVNPMQKIKTPKLPQNNPIFINEIELNQILNYLTKKEFTDIYLLAFHTGMRLGEIVNLRWNQIQLNERVIRVLNTDEFTTKGKKERVIPINSKLYSILINRLPKVINLSGNDLLFHNNGIKLNGDFVSKKFKEAIRKASIEININSQLHMHDLRHSFASNLAKKGVSLYIIKELLGHRDIKTTQIYAHLTIDSLREAVRVLEA